MPTSRRIIIAVTIAAFGILGALSFLGRSLAAGETPAAASAVAPAAIDARTPLPPLDLTGMALWNWNAKWHPSAWANPNSPIPWRPDYIGTRPGGDVVLRFDARGAPQLQALNGTPAARRGLWEADVTLPELQEGLIVAPLWLYDPESRDEIDFEFTGRRGLDVSMHVYVNGVHKQDTVRLFAGQDMSGQRKRFAIALDEDAGWVDMYVDGQRVHRWERAKTGYFIAKPLKPRIEMWAARPDNAGFVTWVGRWGGLPPGKMLTMTVHGYRLKPQ